MKKSLVSIFITLTLLLIVAGCCAYAEGQTQLNVTWINPMYEEYMRDVEFEFRRPMTATRTSEAETEEELAEWIRQRLVSRTAKFSLKYVDVNKYETHEQLSAFLDRVLELAYAHTGVPDEGDYLRFHVGGLGLSTSRSDEPVDGVYKYSFYFEFKMMTDRSEEEEVTAAVAAELAELDLDGLSDYEKAAAIYGFICDTVVYDNESYQEYLERYPLDETWMNYTQEFTAYGALQGKAVCQGIAQLLYRMLLEEGIDCRVIAGRSYSYKTGDDHAWNIVKIGDVYYNLDATWDLGEPGIDYYDYFLLTNAAFEGNGREHLRNTDYTGDAFTTAYPMGSGEPLKAYHSGACRIEDILLLQDGTVGIAICVGAEAYEGDLLAYAEIDGELLPLASAAAYTGAEGEVIRFFTVRKAPKEMQDAVHVALYDGAGNPIPLYEHDAQNAGKWNSVTDGEYVTRVYAGIAAEAVRAGGDTGYAAVMNDLGSSAQRFFGYDAGNAAPLLGSLSDITADDLAGYAESTAGTLPQGLEYAGGTLELDETVTMNFLFYGNVEGVTFKVGETTVTPESNGDYTVVSVSGLTAGELADAHTITAADGVNTYTITASALSYAYKALTEQTDADLQELARALYAWWASCN